MRRLLAGAAVAAMVVLGVGVAAPANAAYPCGQIIGYKTLTTTSALNNGNCRNVQAGIWRYSTSQPTHYVSGWFQTTAKVTATAGTNAGHDYRGKTGYALPNPPGETVYAWQSF